MSTIRLIRLFTKSLLVSISLCFLPGLSVAQSEPSDSADTGKPETSIELMYNEANNHSKVLTATVKTNVKDTYEAVKGISVNFYQKEVGPENLLGTSSSNDKGVAILVVPEDKLSKTSVDYTFIAASENDAKFEDNQEEISVSESDFVMTLEQGDSSRQVLIKLQAPDANGTMAPVAEVEVRLYVQRLFGLLALSVDPETTDENGEISVDFPAGIPGDSAGNLIIVAKVEEHEKFGNLEFQRKISWGTPLIIDPNKNRRELWSSRANAPLYLIFIINTMLIGIWGVIAYIVYEVFKIWKLGRQKAS